MNINLEVYIHLKDYTGETHYNDGWNREETICEESLQVGHIYCETLFVPYSLRREFDFLKQRITSLQEISDQNFPVFIFVERIED